MRAFVLSWGALLAVASARAIGAESLVPSAPAAWAPFHLAPVQFESRESKTDAGGAIFNRVAYFNEGKREVWLMNQSHTGSNAAEWDRLAIVVEQGRGGQPRRARFYQLEPGPLEWPTDLTRTRPARVACFMCHSNGPRLLRPKAGLPWSDQLRVLAWNSRIRGYGRVVSDPITSHQLATRRVRVASCMRCHNESGGRGELTAQLAPTISFMVREGLMPPMGGRITAGERRVLEHL